MIPSFPFVFVCASCVCLCCLCLFRFVCVIDTSRKVESKEGRLEKLAGRKRRPLILSFASPPLRTNSQHKFSTQILNTTSHKSSTVSSHRTASVQCNASMKWQSLQQCTDSIFSTAFSWVTLNCTQQKHVTSHKERILQHLHGCFHTFYCLYSTHLTSSVTCAANCSVKS